jgi:hypothetical protein
LVLQLVGRSVVAGTTRNRPLADASPNMLQAATSACRALAQFSTATPDISTPGNKFGIPLNFTSYPLIQTNGDAELWEQLCTINNPPPVRGIAISKVGTPFFLQSYVFKSSAYPANTPVGAQGGRIVMSSPSGGVTDDNHVPWCIVPTSSSDPADQAAFSKFLADNTVNGQAPPVCPAAILPTLVDDDWWSAFALRGGVNAGFAIFYYLDQVSKKSAATARFNECTLALPSQ